uniref:Uncharacterized protein n=1 Tax=Anguilla anguilla TaxID=7936 RepID=A0A0E9RUP5_ANGAN
MNEHFWCSGTVTFRKKQFVAIMLSLEPVKVIRVIGCL